MRVQVTLASEAGDEASTEQNTRRVLQEKIARATGIGVDDPDGQVHIRFDQSAASEAVTETAGWLSPNLASRIGALKRHTVAGVSVLVVMFVALSWRIYRRRRSDSSHHYATVPPQFRTVNGHRDPLGEMNFGVEFESIAQLRSQEIRSLLSESSAKCLAIALRGAPSWAGDQITEALAPSEADELRREVDALGPVTIREIESSQQEILELLDAAHASVV
jgi:hypothetical protein